MDYSSWVVSLEAHSTQNISNMQYTVGIRFLSILSHKQCKQMEKKLIPTVLLNNIPKRIYKLTPQGFRIQFWQDLYIILL